MSIAAHWECTIIRRTYRASRAAPAFQCRYEVLLAKAAATRAKRPDSSLIARGRRLALIALGIQRRTLALLPYCRLGGVGHCMQARRDSID